MGRPVGTKYIETPERMWQLFCDYRTSIKENPILKLITELEMNDLSRILECRHQTKLK